MGLNENWTRLSVRIRTLTPISKVAAVGFIVVLIGGGIYILKGHSAPVPAETARLRSVMVASVSDLQNDTTPLPLIGEVKSSNEAQIRAESGGSIKHLYHKLGDYVSAGTVIAEIDNSSERAAILQAQGAFENAQASVQKSGKVFTQSKSGVLDTIRSVYSSNDDLIRSKLDLMFSNPRSANPQFVLSTSEPGLVNKVQSARLQLGQLLAHESERAAALSESTDVHAEIETATAETRVVKSYIDDLSALLNASISSQTYPQAVIDGFIASASAARSVASGSLASLSGASQTLISAQTGAEKPSDISSANATLKTAQGSVDAANANLQKTIIRAPISGTLNNLSLHLGDFVSAFQQVAVVSNNGALEIVANITPEDRSIVKIGTRVVIEHQFKGVVTSIAPAVDPITKKIEIKIGVSGSAGLTNGQSVHLDISRAQKTAKSKNTIMAIPISAVKIEATGSVIFTLDETNHLVAHKIKTGALVGDKIEIVSTTTNASTLIVTDARGLKDGQEVTVQ